LALRVEVARKGLATVVAIKGSLHEDAIRDLKQAVRSERDAGVVLFVLDLDRVDALDAAGVGAVLEIEASGRDNGWDLVVIPPGEDVTKRGFADPELQRVLCLLDPEDASYLVELYANVVHVQGSESARWREC
jgi:anti-anti-sigma regulatory factor